MNPDPTTLPELEETCPFCRGAGITAWTARCPTCGGTKTIPTAAGLKIINLLRRQARRPDQPKGEP